MKLIILLEQVIKAKNKSDLAQRIDKITLDNPKTGRKNKLKSAATNKRIPTIVERSK